MRLILFSGGGGAGVTTLAAATAVALAEDGRRVRLLVADHASLFDLLGPAAGLPATVDPQTARPDSALGADAPSLATWARALLAWAGVDAALAGDVARLPITRAVAAILAAPQSSAEIAVVDLGPTGDALSLLHVLATKPESVIEPDRVERLTGRIAGPLLARLVDLPRPDETVRGAGRRLAERFRRLRSILRDSAVTSLRLVLPGDARDARIEREAATVCGLHGIGLDAVVAPCGAAPPLAPGPVRLLMRRREVAPQGTDALAALAGEVYGELDPRSVLSEPRRPQIELTERGADLVLPLPPRPAADFSVARRGDRLEVAAGEWRRTLVVPATLGPLAGRRAWHDGDVFRIRFER